MQWGRFNSKRKLTGPREYQLKSAPTQERKRWAKEGESTDRSGPVRRNLFAKGRKGHLKKKERTLPKGEERGRKSKALFE